MRRALGLILCFAVIAAFILPVQALSSASTSVHATVSGDGECQVVITATIHLDQPTEGLTFPVPRDAHSIKLDGSRARTEKTDASQLVDLSRKAGNMSGDLPITITYSLSDVVVQTETGPQVQIPLLSGFAYPVTELDFSVTLPGEVTAKPAFSSGYRQADIEKDLSCQVEGPKVSGTAVTSLMDHETLLMTLDLPQEMFPRSTFLAPDFTTGYIAMAVCAGVALLYWLLTMRCLPPRRLRETTPPEGHSAGELGSMLTLQGADLTMMIFSWAQLGYVTIHRKHKGKVLVSRQMEMGNERSSFERRYFQKLFAKSTEVDTSSRQYALLRQKAAASSADTQAYVHSRSGSIKIFRILSALIFTFCCGCLGISLGSGAFLQWFMTIVLGGLGFLAGWYIQLWAFSLISIDRRPLWRALILCGVILLLGLIGGQFGIALLGCLSQLLAGLMGAFGGLRTESGKLAMAQVLALRRHLRTLSREDLTQICQVNPDFFHDIAPWALALGVDRQLAAHMGRISIPDSTYLRTGITRALTADQWSELLRQTVSDMDARYHDLSMAQLRQFVRRFTK